MSSGDLNLVLAAEHERPLPTRPDIDLWSENYCWASYDPSSGYGFWLHLGLPTQDFDLWHDISVLYLPGGEDLLLTRGYRDRNDPGDVGGAYLTADFEETTGDWVLRFRGIGYPYSRAELAAGPAFDRKPVPLRYEIRHHAIGEIWTLDKLMEGQVWCNMHNEQAFRVDGWIEVDGKRSPYTGTGNRDHSRGARDITHLGSHFWLHGQMPGGRAFGLLHVDPAVGQDQPLLTAAYLVEPGGRLSEAKVISVPENDRLFTGPVEVVLEGERGEERIRGELLHDMYFTWDYPNEMLYGFRRRGVPQHVLMEGQARWEWDGEIGHGLAERTLRFDADGNPHPA